MTPIKAVWALVVVCIENSGQVEIAIANNHAVVITDDKVHALLLCMEDGQALVALIVFKKEMWCTSFHRLLN